MPWTTRLPLTVLLIALPLLAEASEPKVDAGALATTEAILDYCATLNPAEADHYRAQLKALVQGASEATLKAARVSDAYQRGREAMTDFISKVDEKNGRRVCAEALTAVK
jgi:hypothetical protein